MIEVKEIVTALDKRKEYILGNLENVTMKALRRELEEELGLEKDALKPQKSVITAYIDKLLTANKPTIEDKPSKAEGTVPKEEDNTSKKAGIVVPPSLYKKENTNDMMEDGILELLKKNGLDERSQKSSIMEVKEKLQLERDLDGIDTSNIIEDGPRSRRRAARSFKEQSESEQEDDHSNDDASDDSGVSEDGGSADNVSEDDFPASAGKAKRAKVDDWSEDDE